MASVLSIINNAGKTMISDNCCIDCGKRIGLEYQDYYMVQNSLWERYGVGKNQLCLKCMTSRVGRPLTSLDFTNAIINEEILKDFANRERKKVVSFETSSAYLTEEGLGKFLNILFSDEKIIYNKKIKELGFRPDYYLPDRKLIIEFDGYYHFTDNSIIVSDINKERIMQRLGIKYIRIPYFIQLSTLVIREIFRDEIKDTYIDNHFNNYPQGFIDRKAALPGRFTSLGIIRYNNIMKTYHNTLYNVVFDINTSLCDKVIYSKEPFFNCFPDLCLVKYYLAIFEDIYSMYKDYEKLPEGFTFECVQTQVASMLEFLNTKIC